MRPLLRGPSPRKIWYFLNIYFYHFRRPDRRISEIKILRWICPRKSRRISVHFASTQLLHVASVLRGLGPRKMHQTFLPTLVFICFQAFFVGCGTDANPTHKRSFFSFCVRFLPTQNGFFLVVSYVLLQIWCCFIRTIYHRIQNII